ncbi:hypothetical protein [Comamonas thiooxydans]|uniref:hypothetical protein n=1 Tax=Comamonas thiooxydans TaxID=363952 RepID=UPI00103AD64A|nr:hypothetical protein [Comamonas thiooxydans]
MFTKLVAASVACLTATAYAGNLTGDCADQYRIAYTVKPVGEVVWISPDHVPQSALPAMNEATAGSTTLRLSLSRRSPTQLVAEFTMTSPIHNEALLVAIAMDSHHPQPFSGHIKNSESGSTWGISISPICSEI